MIRHSLRHVPLLAVLLTATSLMDSRWAPVAHAQTSASGASAPATPPAQAASGTDPATDPAAASPSYLGDGTTTNTPDGQAMTGVGLSATSGTAAANGLLGVSAEPSTGVASASYAFALETARGGVQPSLALSYSSAGGVREAGWAWGLNLPVFERYNASGGAHFDDTDRYRFNGNPLIQICVAPTSCPVGMPDFFVAGWSYYRASIEGSFLRFFQSPDRRTWIVQDASGTSTFGVPSDNLNDEGGLEYVDITPPSFPYNDRPGTVISATPQPLVPYRWNLVRRDDATKRNTIQYKWQKLGQHKLAYLTDILDTPHVDFGFAHHTILTWEPQVDANGVVVAPLSVARLSKLTRDLRLKTVDITSAGDPSAAPGRSMVRRYHLGYFAFGKRSLLQTIAVEGRCDQSVPEGATGLPSVTNCPTLPTVTLGYQTPNAGPTKYSLPLSAPLPKQSSLLTPPATFPALLDITSDGLPDLMVAGSPQHFYASTGTALTSTPIGFLQPVLGVTADNFYPANADHVKVGNWLGDGNVNLLWRDDANNYTVYSPAHVGPAWAWFGGTVATNACLTTSDHTVSLDMDGDGLTDEMAIKYVQQHAGNIAFNRAPWTACTTTRDYAGHIAPLASALPMPSYFPNYQFTPGFLAKHLGPEHLLVADINGDSLSDLVSLSAGTWIPNTGAASFWANLSGGGGCGTAPSTSTTPPVLACSDSIPLSGMPTGASSYTFIHDVTGDGFDDLINVTSTYVSVYANTGAGGFASVALVQIPVTALPADWNYWYATKAGPAVFFADMNGSGVDDLVFVGTSSVDYYDLYGNQTPALLNHIDNGLGATSDLTYSTTARLSAAAVANGSPWASQSPQSVPVVQAIATSNHLGGTAAFSSRVDYTYFDPVYDGDERLFRGFKKVRSAYPSGETVDVTYLIGRCQIDAQCGPAADNPLEALRGLPVLVEQYAGALHLSTIHNTYLLKQTWKGLDGRWGRFAYPSQTDTWLFDTATAGTTTTTTTVTDVSSGTEEFSGSSTSTITVSSGGDSAHLQIQQVRDSNGHVTNTTDFGKVGFDTPILRSYVWSLPPGDTSGWRYRMTWSEVAAGPKQAGLPRELPRHMRYDYTAIGQLQSVGAYLDGVLPLNRFHEDPTKNTPGQGIAPAPPYAVQSAQNVQLSYRTYDPYGNVNHVENSNNYCEDLTYDAYYQFPRSSLVHPNGCASAPLTTSWTYDRGLEAVVMTVTPDTGVSTTTFDGFGRPKDTFLPDATTPGIAELGARDHVDYFPPDATHPTERIRVTLVTDGINKHVAWAYSDGLGRKLVTVSEGDTGGQWIASGVARLDTMGNVVARYRPYSLSVDPSAVDVSKLTGTAAYTYKYDPFGRLTTSTDIDGVTTMSRTAYHALSRDSFDAEDENLKSPHFNTPTTVTYDGHGRVVAMLERINTAGAPANVLTSASYTATGDLASIKRGPEKGTATYQRWMQYDTLGRLVVNAEPNTSSNFADADHAASDPAAGRKGMKAWTYAYDIAGHMVGTVDARGCGKNTGYDGMGRVLWEDFSPCLKTQAAYSAVNPTTGDGSEAFYVWDNDPAAPSLFNAARLVTVYDRASVTRSQHDGHGRVVSIQRRLAAPGTSPSLSARYATTWFSKSIAFDAVNRVDHETTGARALAQFNDTIQYAHSPRGFVTSVTGNYGTLLANATYDADGLPTSATLGDKAQTKIIPQYDGRRRLQRVTVSSTNYTPPTALGTGTYVPLTQDDEAVLDDVGNPTKLLDHRDPNAWPPGAKPIASKTIGYDDFYRVTAVAAQTAGDTQKPPFDAEIKKGDVLPVVFSAQAQQRVQSQTFSYDALGNTATSDDESHSFFDRSLGAIANGTPSTGPNRMTGAGQVAGPLSGTLSVAYDAAGNVTDVTVNRSPGEHFTYVWDEVGRLAQARRFDAGTGVVAIAYAYDAGGQRVLKSTLTLAGTTYDAFIFPTLELAGTRWIASGTAPGPGTPGTSTGDYRDAVDTEVVYLGGYGRLFYSEQSLPATSSGHTHTFLQFGDRLGSTTTIIDKDTSEVVERVSYGPYGTIDSDYRPERWGSFRAREHFAAKMDDYAVGVSYFGARYYSAQLGRWLSADPLAVHDLGADLNPYAYVSGATFAAVDPYGLEGEATPDPIQIGPGSGSGGTGGGKPENPGGGGNKSPGGGGGNPQQRDPNYQAPQPLSAPTIVEAPDPTPGAWATARTAAWGLAVGGYQGYVPFGMATELAKALPGDHSNLSPTFLHWQAAGQTIGGTIAMIQGGYQVGGGAIACATGVGCVAGAGVAAVGAAQATNGYLAVSHAAAVAQSGQQAAQNPQSNGGTSAPAPQQSAASGGSTSGFTGSNFRENLIKTTGGAPENAQAHHVFPQKFEAQFKSMGIDIHDPKFGAWWDATAHAKNSTAYNQAWSEFFASGATGSQGAMDYARSLAKAFGYGVNF